MDTKKLKTKSLSLQQITILVVFGLLS